MRESLGLPPVHKNAGQHGEAGVGESVNFSVVHMGCDDNTYLTEASQLINIYLLRFYLFLERGEDRERNVDV